MFEIHPPLYPLDRDAFVVALATGHGRVLIHAERFGVDEFRSEILGAATEPAGFDTQVDGYGEWQLAKLCEAAGLVGEIIHRKVAGDDVWLRCALLKEFFLTGHAAALQALREMWDRHLDGNDLPAVEELIALDGERGLSFVAGKLGELLARGNGFWVDGHELEMFDEVHGTGAAESILKREAATDDRIAIYLAGVESTLALRSGMEKGISKKPVAEVTAEIRAATERFPRLQAWGRKASEGDRRQIAEILSVADDPRVVAKALSCFSGTGFPVFDPALLAYLEHPDLDVRSEAIAALSHHDEEEVRAAGLEAIRGGDGLTGLELLRKAARADDLGEILRTLHKAEAEHHDFHSHISAAVGMLQYNPEVWEIRLAMLIYERSPCRHCRGLVVTVMVRRGECPPWITEEAHFDASNGIRALLAAEPE